MTSPSSSPVSAAATPAASNHGDDGIATAKEQQSPDIEKGAAAQREHERPPTYDPFDESAKFDLDLHLRRLREKAEDIGLEQRTMGVAFRGLSVDGVGAGLTQQATMGSLVTEATKIHHHIANLFHSPPIRHILQDVTGCVKPGEMLLVLGRPGSGCTTLLKTLAKLWEGYKDVRGDVSWEGFGPKELKGPLRPDVVYCPEDDIHFPTLQVGDTLDFAIASRAPQAKRRMDLEQVEASRKEYIRLNKEVIATTLGLRHTYNTPVGNELIRGISGGEKKRVSIAEILASRCRVACFDNSSRGLDSSTALEFVQAMRTATDVGQLATLCSMYQPGQALTDLFDKVIVLNEGRMVFFGGKMSEAHEYFYSLGFEPQPRQTTADFLVACTDSLGRRIRPGYEGRVPKTPDEQALAFQQSAQGQKCREQVDEYIAELARARSEDEATQKYRDLAQQDKAKRVPDSSRFVLSWRQQITLSIKRRAQIMWGDKLTTIIISVACTMQALIIGSTFYDMPTTSAGFFSRGGVLFFSLLYFAFLSAAEIPNSYAQRPIVIRHHRFGFCSPAADSLANTLLDIPVRCISITCFSLILYFLTGLHASGSAFFIFYSVVILSTLAMTATFRALAAIFRAEATATLCSGLVIIALSLYAGYVVPRPSMVDWWRWISYANPLSFAFEILITNEFRNLNVPCASLIPAGPSYANVDPANQVCAISGARPGQTIINGLEYADYSFGYLWENRKRNAGIILAMFVFSVTVYAVATEFQSDPSSAGGVMVFKKGTAAAAATTREKKTGADGGDVELGKGGTPETMSADRDAAIAEIETSKATFSWHHLNYEVLVKGKPRQLLCNVSGYVKPGSLVALMGASGAGKTTLLNVLAHRTSTGVVTGDLKLSGRPVPASFQAGTSYCQQMDVHLATSSVREALRFSAELRQPAEVSLADKHAYVEQVLSMLEMNEWADAIVGEVGQGLSVEQRKRLTIGVELAAKPSLLLFLDEPTSGLDGQAAWSIVRLLRKLADAGQAIVCTIHQPSGELFCVFDRLLLLERGGRTVYFGDIGTNGNAVADYFQSRSGQVCKENDNVAEYMLDVIGAGASGGNAKGQDWHALFVASDMHRQLQRDLVEIESSSEGLVLSPEEEARGRREYAASYMTQLRSVFWRTAVHYWRDPIYLGSKIGLCLFAGLFIGSSFWQQGSKVSVASLQNKLFAIFMSLVLSVSLAQQMQPIFLLFRSVYEARESPSKLYHWTILPLTYILVEVPWNIVASTTFWLPWFFMTRFNPDNSARAAFSWFLICVLFQIYWTAFAAAVATVSANAMIASVAFSFFFSFVVVFCGVVQPPALMPYFWRQWLPPLSPFTYLLESLLANTLINQPVRCEPAEFSTLVPPQGQSCEAFLSNFSSTLDQPPLGPGYYQTAPDGMSCSYCQYREGITFLSGLSAGPTHFDASHRFRNVGILAAYCLFNLALLGGLFWLRVRPKNAGSMKASKMPAAAGTQGDKVEQEKQHAGDATTRAAALTASHPEAPGEAEAVLAGSNGHAAANATATTTPRNEAREVKETD